MLQQTFIHIRGIGKQTELDLWEHVIHSWDDADRFEKRFGAVGGRLQKKLDEYIPRSREAIRRKDAAFFERLSTVGEAWRVFPEFVDQCVYLDIETTGLSSVFDTITTVGLYAYLNSRRKRTLAFSPARLLNPYLGDPCVWVTRVLAWRPVTRRIRAFTTAHSQDSLCHMGA